jgi:hypothetical protein
MWDLIRNIKVYEPLYYKELAKASVVFCIIVHYITVHTTVTVLMCQENAAVRVNSSNSA